MNYWELLLSFLLGDTPPSLDEVNRGDRGASLTTACVIKIIGSSIPSFSLVDLSDGSVVKCIAYSPSETLFGCTGKICVMFRWIDFDSETWCWCWRVETSDTNHTDTLSRWTYREYHLNQHVMHDPDGHVWISNAADREPVILPAYRIGCVYSSAATKSS